MFFYENINKKQNTPFSLFFQDEMGDYLLLSTNKMGFLLIGGKISFSKVAISSKTT